MREETLTPLPEPTVHAVTAADGWVLRVYDFQPEGPARGVVLVGHAMMVDARTLCRADRPTLVSTLVDAGLRVLVPDQRGHGGSGPTPREGADWSYDDLVADLDVYVELARDLDPRLPIALVGHSLFGHASLAWLGQHPEAPVRCAALVACDVWNRRFEPSWSRWLVKRCIYGASRVVVWLVGYMPTRWLRVGTADEAATYWQQFHQWIVRDRWTSLDGGIDFHEGLGGVSCPVLHVVSEGDTLYARPPSALNFTAALAQREILVLGRDDAPGRLSDLRPSHMGVITDPASEPAWRAIARWLVHQLAAS